MAVKNAMTAEFLRSAIAGGAPDKGRVCGGPEDKYVPRSDGRRGKRREPLPLFFFRRGNHGIS